MTWLLLRCFLASLLLAALGVAPVCCAPSDPEVCAAGASSCPGSQKAPFWPRRGANNQANGNVPHVGPTNISGLPAWRWENYEDELHRHGPVIDGEGNIYMTTAYGWVRKFAPDGRILWAYRTRSGESRSVTGPALYNGSIFFFVVGSNFTSEHYRFLGGYALALSMETGEVQWKATLPQHLQEPDSQTVTASDGVLLGAMRRKDHPAMPEVGANKVIALSTTDGSFKWDYDMDGVVWNFMPALPGDGTMLFSTSCGRAHKLDLQTGKELWKAAFEEPGQMCSTSGGTLGPDGKFYVAVNYFSGNEHSGQPFEDISPCRPGNCPENKGLFLVYDIEDGKIVFKKRSGPLMQYPAVGQINGRMAVVLSIGENPRLVTDIFRHMDSYLPSYLREWSWLHAKLLAWQYEYEWVRRFFEIPVVTENTVMAADTVTGEVLWQFTEEPWVHWAAAGDEEGFVRRLLRFNFRIESQCAPDSWAIPIIAGDGTVYASSGHTGNLYAINDRNGDRKLDPSEVSTHKFGQGFVNGPALAPGLLAVTPCWGPLHVFRSNTE